MRGGGMNNLTTYEYTYVNFSSELLFLSTDNKLAARAPLKSVRNKNWVRFYSVRTQVG